VKFSAEKLAGKCTVKHSDDIEDLSLYTTLPDHFYLNECWNSGNKSSDDVPSEAR
jgi:hypothetical protein